MTPGEYLAQRRVGEARWLLITTDKSIIDIAHRCGFHSQSNFYQHFAERCRTSPGRYRQGHGQQRAADAMHEDTTVASTIGRP